MSAKLEEIYSAEIFRKKGHDLVDKLAHLLDQSLAKKIDVNKFKEPESRLSEWRKIVENKNLDHYFEQLIADSIHLHHPHYMGHQISPPAPLAALSGLLADFVNNGMGVYEMGGPSTALERIVIKTISDAMGYDDNADGFLTSGGTLANLTALLTARAMISEAKIWTEGNLNQRWAIMVSEQAHYCVDRAVRIMGLGEEGVIRLPVNDNFEVDVKSLESYYNKARNKGIKVFAIVGSACTTSTGSYDDLKSLGTFARLKNIWFHVDGAHGGAVAFSEKYKPLLAGIEMADSVIVDCHKMMMTPALATALIYKNGENGYATFTQHAQYLFDKEEKEWYNLAKRTFECTKFMMSVKFAGILIEHGIEGIGNFVTRLYDLGQIMADQINKRKRIELAHIPSSNIVCFRLLRPELSEDQNNNLNRSVREKLLHEGKYYIVQTNLNGVHYLRTTLMNPFTTKDDLNGLLDYLEAMSDSFD